ncbi:MAG: argininosuccinate lyase [bacterium]
MKLWDKGKDTDSRIGEFTAGKDRESDMQLAVWDVLGSIAHARMLENIGLLTTGELLSIERELKKLYHKIDKGEFRIMEDVEDIHSQVELSLTEVLGDTGKKLHTARSRNDQVLLDLKLFGRDKIKEIARQANSLFRTLISLSNEHRNLLMPGYTHMQIAMPSSFGLWFGAYAESLAEDMIILRAAYNLTNYNPLGSAAGFGSSFPVNRSLTTKLLGFDDMHYNVVNAQMNRGKMEKSVAFSMGQLGSTLSKLAMDICLYSGQNFGFISLPEEYTTGSSIMPHKKNPDVFELVRAKGNKLQSLSFEISLIGANLPSGYHRDYQLIKENFIPSFDILLEMLSITEMVIKDIRISPEITGDSLYQDIFSVEEVNKLVLQGTSFRDAYRKVAEKISDGSYNADKRIDHTHEGSIGNLCNDRITDKMNKIMESFDFEKTEKAMMSLLE